MKKFKGIVAVLLVAIMLFSMAGCGKINEMSAKDFKLFNYYLIKKRLKTQPLQFILE